ncbi:10051_t:CDS:1, partial [Entrophospora sp. SA101]
IAIALNGLQAQKKEFVMYNLRSEMLLKYHQHYTPSSNYESQDRVGDREKNSRLF